MHNQPLSLVLTCVEGLCCRSFDEVSMTNYRLFSKHVKVLGMRTDEYVQARLFPITGKSSEKEMVNFFDIHIFNWDPIPYQK